VGHPGSVAIHKGRINKRDALSGWASAGPSGKPAWAENLFQIGTDDGFEGQFGRNSTRYEEVFAAQNTFV
jgi:hypothetical protein